jgi:hypothetical protein
MLEAFANIYGDLHAAIAAHAGGQTPRPRTFRGSMRVWKWSGSCMSLQLVEESRTVDPGLIGQASVEAASEQYATTKA